MAKSILNKRLTDLTDMREMLFPKDLEEDLPDSDVAESTFTPNKLFEFVQSINQYFYFVEIATIDGVELNNKDWIVAYNQDVIVGARPYMEGARIDVPVMGYDNSSENTKIATAGYCENGDLPIIKVHRSDGQIIEMDVIKIDGDLEFKGIGHATIVLKKD